MNKIKLYKFCPKIVRREILNFKARLTQDVIIKFGSSGGYNNIFEGKNLINSKASVKNSQLGYATYISGECDLQSIIVGRFCSIGQRVSNSIASHPSSIWVSTHPSFFSLGEQAGFTFVNKQRFKETKYADEQKRIRNIIGNDVWIGSDVKLLPGVEIGDGAIIATGAVITKNVEPYSIIGGAPAKHIRYRFNEKQIKWLMDFKWWDKSIKWVTENAEFFEDIEKFIVKNTHT